MNYTSIEQSKKLLELGLNTESADCMWEQHNSESPYITVKPHTTLGRSIGAHAIPCWSVGALLNILSIYELSSCGDSFDINCKGFALESENGETLIDLIFNMVVYLLECGYIKK